jgi:hypothetical protein
MGSPRGDVGVTVVDPTPNRTCVLSTVVHVIGHTWTIRTSDNYPEASLNAITYVMTACGTHGVFALVVDGAPLSCLVCLTRATHSPPRKAPDAILDR